MYVGLKELFVRRLLSDSSGTTTIKVNNFGKIYLWSLRNSLRVNVIGKPAPELYRFCHFAQTQQNN